MNRYTPTANDAATSCASPRKGTRPFDFFDKQLYKMQILNKSEKRNRLKIADFDYFDYSMPFKSSFSTISPFDISPVGMNPSFL